MPSISCPYCGSHHVELQPISQGQFQAFEQLMQHLSPLQLAMLGIKLSKRMGVPPYIGGLVGVVVGSSLIMASQHYFYRYYQSVPQYRCLDCQQSFAVVDTS